jgi:pectin methylesterase-like acyl-CoA thioesterase
MKNTNATSLHWKSLLTFCLGRTLVVAGLLAAVCLVSNVPAATIVWSGASGTDTNWSNGNNWVGNAAPGGGDDAKFFNAGTNGTAGTPDNLVDGIFPGNIGSLQYGNTNGFHTTAIASGQTLNITNTGGLIVGTPTDIAVAYTNRATITGSGGTLNVSNTTAVISLNQGTATAVNFSQSILDLSGLGNFNATVSRIGLGTTTTLNPGNANQREAGSLYLAMTNNITVTYSVPLATYQTVSGSTNGIELQKNPGNNGGSTTPTILYLGLTNVINVDSIGIGRDKSDASCYGRMLFNPVFIANSPVAYFYGVTGPGSRVTWWCIGDDGGAVSSSHGGFGISDFTGGTVNAFVNVMSLGRDSTSSSTWAGPNKGTLTFTAGTIDANTLLIGNQSVGPSTSTTPNVGIVSVIGANALLRVNTTLTLGNTANSTSTAAQNTYGTLNVTNGTVYANNVTVGAYTTSGNNAINLTNATLIITNSLATNATGLAALNIGNSLLGLTVPANAALVGLVKNLSTFGTTNAIQLSVPVFSSYPQTIPLIQYTTLNGTFNFGLTNVPASAPGAYLTNVTTTPQFIALVLPTDPAPLITAQPQPFSGSPGSTVTLTVTNTGNTPLSYQWYYTNGVTTNLLSGASGPSGDSTMTGSTSNILTIANAQAGDSGGYLVVITNLYGSATSTLVQVTISSSAVPPTVSGPTNLTVIAGNNATINDSVAGSPIPALQWLDQTGTPIPGATTASLTLSNVQYSQNGYTYSLVATNIAGSATNITTLTVIVPPVITSQPSSLVVTNTQSASFTVAATGVPNPWYQWNKNGNPISGAGNNTATNATFTIASVSSSDTASYSCTITNLAGSTNSTSVTLTVNSTMAVTALAPTNGATGICYDTPLHITFNQTPSLNKLGKVRIYNVTNSTTPVDTLDLTLNTNLNVPYAVNVQPRTIGVGGDTFYSFPVIITGSTAVIYPHAGVMTSNQTYYVTIDDGVFADTSGAYFAGISATDAWQFTTKVAGPANRTNLIVAADGSGDFLTVQGAVDSVPANNTTPTFINVQSGVYTEIVDVKSKNNLDFRGQTRTGSIIGYPNNNYVNQSGAPLRAMFVLNGNDCTFENIMVTNTTPSGGSQAEAVDVEGTRAIFYNMELDSYQDTFLVHSAGKLVYFQDCLIQGQTDFNWGYGTVYYTNCEVRCLLSGGHVTQPRSPATTNGFGFINCRITQGYSGASTFDLGRTIGTPTSLSEVLFYNCLMADVITGYASDAGTNMADYACSNLTATATKTLVFSTHSPSNDPFVIAIQSATNWLYGWQPQVAPNIIGQPTNATVSQGQSTNFTVTATGIPAPTYQWLKNSTNISNATNATLTISNAKRSDAASYTVVVSNGSGSVTSVVATLTYTGDIAPVVANIVTNNVTSGLAWKIAISDLKTAAGWSDPDGDTVTLSSVTSPSANGTNVTSDGTFIYYNGPVNAEDHFNYTVTDGTLTAGGTVYLEAVAGTAPSISNPAVNGSGHPTFSGSGIPGYTYGVERATGLSGPWVNAGTVTAGANGSWSFTDASQTNPGTIFYRLYYPFSAGSPPQ